MLARHRTILQILTHVHSKLKTLGLGKKGRSLDQQCHTERARAVPLTSERFCPRTGIHRSKEMRYSGWVCMQPAHSTCEITLVNWSRICRGAGHVVDATEVVENNTWTQIAMKRRCRHKASAQPELPTQGHKRKHEGSALERTPSGSALEPRQRQRQRMQLLFHYRSHLMDDAQAACSASSASRGYWQSLAHERPDFASLQCWNYPRHDAETD